jgi:cation:H+ antiporter
MRAIAPWVPWCRGPAKLAGGLVLLVLGSQVLVKGATTAAVSLGEPNRDRPHDRGRRHLDAGAGDLLGGGLPRQGDLAIGNVVGSNLLNQLLILGLCGLASGGQGLAVDPVMVNRDFPIMVLTTLACLPIFWTHGVITRLEGGILVGLYGLYLVEHLLSATRSESLDEFRLLVLVVVLPLLLVFLVAQMIRWRAINRRTGST